MFTKPTFLIDKEKAIKNIQKIIHKIEATNVDFRPHFKTHQSAEVGAWFRDFGIKKITVSSLDMAIYFAQNGWQNITWAFPTNILEIDRINALAKSIKLNLLVENVEVIQFLADNLLYSASIFIKIDTGYGRTGVVWSDTAKIQAILELCNASEKLQAQGFLAHFGHTYQARGKTAIETIYQEGVQRLQRLKQHFVHDFPNLKISVGDTPSCSVLDSFEGVDEIRPGNFVYYDLMQWQIGACTLDEIAVAVACPIVAIHPERQEVVIHGGGVHFSKEFIEKNSKRIYGMIVENRGDKWGNIMENIYLKKLSQEHGIVQVNDAFLQKHKIGDVLKILPVHSCMTANLMRDYVVL